MVNNKNKEFDKAAALNNAVNFCAIFSLVFVVGLLLIANAMGGNQSRASLMAALQNCSGTAVTVNDSQSLDPSVLFPTLAEEDLGPAVGVVMDDGGYAQKELNISFTGTKTIEIENKGSMPHSFVVDGLNIDSGEIEPGQTGTVVLENLSNEVKNYTYYSNVIGDDKESFSGVIMVRE